MRGTSSGSGGGIEEGPDKLNWIRQDEADRGERADRPGSEMVEANTPPRKRVMVAAAPSSQPDQQR